MSWSISVPHRDRAERLIDALSSVPRALEGEDRAVAQQVMLSAMFDGAETVGDLLDTLGAASPAERRAMLDEARAEAGLRSTAAADARRQIAASARAAAHLPERDEAGFAFLLCAAENCTSHPVDQMTGAPAKVNVRRWWCERHRDLAAEGDMDRWSSGLRYAPGGGLEWAGEVEAERKRALRDEERLRHLRAQQQAEREAEAAEWRSRDAATLEHFRPKGRGWEP